MKVFLNSIVLLVLLSCGGKGKEENKEDEFIKDLPGSVQNDKTTTNLGNSKASALDSILGDKLEDIKTKKIRANNFEKLIGLDVKNLQDSSSLYAVKKLGEGYYLLKQKKQYEEARHFNIILKTVGAKVVDYFVLNDFSITDIKEDKNEWLLLCSDWDNSNIYWKSSQQIMIFRMDKSFKTIWKYQVDHADYPFEAISIETPGETSSYKINVITGCHICCSIVKLELDEKGKFKSVKETAVQNSRRLEQGILNSLFDVKRK